MPINAARFPLAAAVFGSFSPPSNEFDKRPKLFKDDAARMVRFRMKMGIAP